MIFSLDFPYGCSYAGPRSLPCYEVLWQDVGCLDKGHASPDNMSSAEIALLNGFDIRLLVLKFVFC